MPASDKHAALAACFRSNRKDLNVEKDLREDLTWNVERGTWNVERGTWNVEQ